MTTLISIISILILIAIIFVINKLTAKKTTIDEYPPAETNLDENAGSTAEVNSGAANAGEQYIWDKTAEVLDNTIPAVTTTTSALDNVTDETAKLAGKAIDTINNDPDRKFNALSNFGPEPEPNIDTDNLFDPKDTQPVEVKNTIELDTSAISGDNLINTITEYPSMPYSLASKLEDNKISEILNTQMGQVKISVETETGTETVTTSAELDDDKIMKEIGKALKENTPEDPVLKRKMKCIEANAKILQKQIDAESKSEKQTALNKKTRKTTKKTTKKVDTSKPKTKKVTTKKTVTKKVATKKTKVVKEAK